MGDVNHNDDSDIVIDLLAKEKFEKERGETLTSLPEEITKWFGVIGFSPGEDDDDDGDDDDDDDDDPTKKKAAVKFYQPILLVSPYDVPPKPVRDIYWMDTYTKAKRSKAKLKKLDYLAYVYGSDDPDDCYNFVPQHEFVSLEEGIQRGYDRVPSASSSSLLSTDTQQRLRRGLQELHDDADKTPNERRIKHTTDHPFLERHAKKKKKKEEGASSSPPTKKQRT